MQISFVGAGNVATSLGNLFSQAGHTVRYSSQSPQEGQVSIAEAAAWGEVVCFAIPYSAMKDVLSRHKETLRDKIVIDITNAINLEDWSPLFLGEDSSGEQSARLLPHSRVVKAFNTVFADVMDRDKQQFAGHRLSVFIASDDEKAAQIVKSLAEDAGFDGFLVGNMRQARHLEALAHLNIAIALGGGGTEAGFVYFQRK